MLLQRTVETSSSCPSRRRAAQASPPGSPPGPLSSRHAPPSQGLPRRPDHPQLSCPDTVVVVDPTGSVRSCKTWSRNAIRHSHPAGFVDLRATARDGCLRVDVTTTARGSSPPTCPDLDRFWRAEKSRSRAAGGSGLGLAIVRPAGRSPRGEPSARVASPATRPCSRSSYQPPTHPPGNAAVRDANGDDPAIRRAAWSFPAGGGSQPEIRG